MSELRKGYELLDEAYAELARHKATLEAVTLVALSGFINRRLASRCEDLVAYLQGQIIDVAESIQRMLEGDDLPF